MSYGARASKIEKRQHVRVLAQFRNHFSSKNRMVAGDGELKDLSPGGCGVTSPVAVPLGAELEFCIFPGKEGNPFIIEVATVRWTRHQEFGLAFTQIRPAVQRQLVELCRKRAPLD